MILRGFARPNLELAVAEVDGAKDVLARTHEVLTQMLAPPRAPARRWPRRSSGRPLGRLRGGAIVYTATRRAAENIARDLSLLGWGARAYHAGLSSQERSRVQGAFSDKSVAIVAATNAFGMGIDRDDVRAVVHAQPPSSIEATTKR